MSRNTKGSKRHLQDALVGRPTDLEISIRDSLPTIGQRRMTWVSPLPPDYAEYHDAAFLEALDLREHVPALPRFWPAGGPRWDALATVEGGGALLVEAKARVAEVPDPDRWTPPSGSERSRVSHGLIEASLADIRAHLGVRPDAHPWTEHHYQIANRLGHLWWLHVDRGVPAWLVLLGFTGSPDWPDDPLTDEGWRRQMACVFEDLGVPHGHPLEGRIGIAVLGA